MNPAPVRGPQHGLLFRLVAVFSRLRFDYLLRSLGHGRILTGVFLFGAGVTALGTITMSAYLTRLMLLFPPLGPSAFILFHTPLAETASPRNVIAAHALAMAAGLMALFLAGLLFPQAAAHPDLGMNWHGVTSVALAMGLVSIVMVAGHCIHPPAAATALIAALGYLQNWIQVVGVLLTVIILVLEAILFNRILGGLPYPLWRYDPKQARHYGVLAGCTDPTSDHWGHQAARTFRRRSS